MGIGQKVTRRGHDRAGDRVGAGLGLRAKEKARALRGELERDVARPVGVDLPVDGERGLRRREVALGVGVAHVGAHVADHAGDDVVRLLLVDVLEEHVSPSDDAVARRGDLLEEERAEVLGHRAVAPDLPGQRLAPAAFLPDLERADDVVVRQLDQELPELDRARVLVAGGNRPVLLDRVDLGARENDRGRRASERGGRDEDGREDQEFRPAQPAEAFKRPEEPGTEHLGGFSLQLFGSKSSASVTLTPNGFFSSDCLARQNDTVPNSVARAKTR